MLHISLPVALRKFPLSVSRMTKCASRPTAKLLVHPVRIMRVLAASRYVAEASAESYIATPLTRTMALPPIEAAVRSMSVFSQFQVSPIKLDHLRLWLT